MHFAATIIAPDAMHEIRKRLDGPTAAHPNEARSNECTENVDESQTFLPANPSPRRLMSMPRSRLRPGPGARPLFCLNCGTKQTQLWAPPSGYSGRPGARRETVTCTVCGEEHQGEYTSNIVGWMPLCYWRPMKGLADELPRSSKLP